MHVQYSTQNYLQTYGHPEHFSYASRFKSYLKEFKELTEKRQIRPIFNLQPALELIEKWETELAADTSENTEFIGHIRSEMDKLSKCRVYNMQFHPRLINLMCRSRVFLYANLLPPVPFRHTTLKKSEFMPGED